jgi:hypothetical protein
MARKNAGKSVGEILLGKKGSVRNAPLERGSPSWDEIERMTWEEVTEKAEADVPGFKTIKKLLGDKRFDK